MVDIFVSILMEKQPQLGVKSNESEYRANSQNRHSVRKHFYFRYYNNIFKKCLDCTKNVKPL